MSFILEKDHKKYTFGACFRLSKIWQSPHVRIGARYSSPQGLEMWQKVSHFCWKIKKGERASSVFGNIHYFFYVLEYFNIWCDISNSMHIFGFFWFLGIIFVYFGEYTVTHLMYKKSKYIYHILWTFFCRLSGPKLIKIQQQHTCIMWFWLYNLYKTVKFY